MPKPLKCVFSPVFAGSVPKFLAVLYHNSDEWRTKKKTATVKLRLFACLVIRILQDVSREKAMEQMFA